MKTFILILKGMLLYTTALATILFISGIDSLYDNGNFLYGLFIIAALIRICTLVLNKTDLEKLSLEDLFFKNNK